MTHPHAFRISLLIALLLSVYTLGSASVLQGQVTEVIDGATITVVSIKHPVRVRILGIAPPDAHQQYADVARQHLADLVLNKFVAVHYSQLDGNYLLGQVVAGSMDVGAQMIRDGVAWYDQADEQQLSDGDLHIYVESELTARSERRGLWKDQAAVSPWEFRKDELARRNATVVPLPRSDMFVPRGNAAGLSSDDLFGGVVGPGSLAGKPSFRKINVAGEHDHWSRFHPEDQHFSVLAPSDANEISYPILDGQGKAITVRYVVGAVDGTFYVVMWLKGSNDNATDASVAAITVKGFLSGLNRSLEQARQGFVLTSKTERALSLEGYAGRQYSLSGGDLAGVVRVLSKQVGDQREMFMLGVIHTSDAENAGERFLNSFRIMQAKAR